MNFVDLAACGDNDGIKELLAEAGTTDAQVNALDKDGRSALHYACLNDDIQLLEAFLADPRVKVDLMTPKGEFRSA